MLHGQKRAEGGSVVASPTLRPLHQLQRIRSAGIRLIRLEQPSDEPFKRLKSMPSRGDRGSLYAGCDGQGMSLRDGAGVYGIDLHRCLTATDSAPLVGRWGGIAVLVFGDHPRPRFDADSPVFFGKSHADGITAGGDDLALLLEQPAMHADAPVARHQMLL